MQAKPSFHIGVSDAGARPSQWNADVLVEMGKVKISSPLRVSQMRHRPVPVDAGTSPSLKLVLHGAIFFATCVARPLQKVL